jgi:ribonuclease J
VACAVDTTNRHVVGEVQVEMRGITGGDDDYLARDAQRTVQRSLEKALSDQKKKPRDWEKSARQSLQSLLWDRIKQRPMVIVNLIEI